MALYEYEYDISTDFTSLEELTDLNITILQQEIDEEFGSESSVHHILANIDDDLCVVYFETELTTQLEDGLDIIIAAHTGKLPGGEDPGEVGDGEGGPSDINFVFGDQGNDYHLQFSSTCYKIGFQMIFRGTNTHGEPIGVQMILKGKGKLKLYDKTNGKTLFEWKDFDENDWTICSIPISNFNEPFPSGQAMLELWGAKTNQNLYVSSFQLTYSGEVINRPPDQNTGDGS